MNNYSQIISDPNILGRKLIMFSIYINKFNNNLEKTKSISFNFLHNALDVFLHEE